MKIYTKKTRSPRITVVMKRIAMVAMLLSLSTSMMYAKKEKGASAKTPAVVKNDSTKGFETLLWGDTVEQVKEKGYAIEHDAVENKAKAGFSEETERYSFSNKNYKGSMFFLNDKLYAVTLRPPKNGEKFLISDIQKRFGEFPYYFQIGFYSDAKTEGRSEPNFERISSASIFYNESVIRLFDWQYNKDHSDVGRVLTGKKTFEDMEKEKELAAEKAKEDAEIDAKGKEIAKGYVYHGTAEGTQNAKLFSAGALEEGHAYYIPAYMAGSRGTTGAAFTSLFGSPKYHIVEYASQKVRGEVVTAGESIMGNLPISVIVVGGKAPLHTPIVIGLIE